MDRLRLRERVQIVESEHGGAVVLDEQAGVYWQLNRLAQEMVASLEDGLSCDEVVEILSSRYAVEPSVVEADLRSLVDRLVGLGLGVRTT